MKWGGNEKPNDQAFIWVITVLTAALVIFYLLFGHGTFWIDFLVIFLCCTFEFFITRSPQRR